MKKITITIGIPAYNEEQNIKILLERIFEQKIRNAKLEKVIIVSDASKDRTVEIVKSMSNKRIKIINHNKRVGKPKSINEIINRTEEDVLVILDADILPTDHQFLHNLIEPITKNHKIGLVGADTVPAKPLTFFESIIANSHTLKTDLYKKINEKNNIYLCHGRARAFSKMFYSKLNFSQDCPEDAFSYLMCIQKGFKFSFAEKAKVIFRSPSTPADHIKQSKRFQHGQESLEKYFTSELIKKSYKIPKVYFAETLLKYLIISPLKTILFIIVNFYIKLFTNNQYDQSTWEISPSTKGIIKMDAKWPMAQSTKNLRPN